MHSDPALFRRKLFYTVVDFRDQNFLPVLLLYHIHIVRASLQNVHELSELCPVLQITGTSDQVPYELLSLRERKGIFPGDHERTSAQMLDVFNSVEPLEFEDRTSFKIFYMLN